MIVYDFALKAASSYVARSDEFDAAKTYVSLAVADPKAPFEFKAMGPALWFTQVAAISSVLYIVDPLRIREGEGLDEIWFSGYNPVYWPVTERVRGAKDWLFSDEEQPSPWDYW